MASEQPEEAGSAVPVVGIGASAGGLEALQIFFQNLPADLGAAYVVIVHLAPDRESELPSILGRETSMPVVQVGDHDKAALEADHVYVIAPDHKLELTDSSVGSSRFEQPRGRRAAIDLFFRSLCAARGDVYGVILSGGGSDGAVGARAIKEAGGLVLVQDPNEAGHDSMPRAAMGAGVADVVLPVRELAGRLTQVLKNRGNVIHLLSPSQAEPSEADREEAALRAVLDLLKRRTGHDFSRYKRNTVLRRLVRRMQLHHASRLDDYLKYLEQNVEEVQALFDDLLITVTTFFRDPEAWSALAEHVVRPLLQQAGPSETLRCWVPGCATGEEAYSLAMLFGEEMERLQVMPELIIFASDVDERGLAQAREGVYPRSIETDVSDERLKRWFKPVDDHYQVAAELRERVVFASHSLQRDPPFSRLHLISCRNLLIYLDADLQTQVMEIFRYAGREGGYLFLGSAETASSELFSPVSKQHRIYRVRADAGSRKPRLPELPTGYPVVGARHERNRPSRVERQRSSDVHQVLLEEMAPPSIVVDDQWNIRTLSETAGRFLQPRGGPATHLLTELVRAELRGELIVALRHAFQTHEQWLSEFVPVQFNGTPNRVGVLVQPRSRDSEAPAQALVTFLEAGPPPPGSEAALDSEASGNDRERMLLEKLHQAEQQIEHLHADHHASEEDLRAVNEELQSLNEEYRSTTEELETSKEELQSINEELQTVNLELKIKLEEISHAHDDLENLMAATDIPTLFLDRQLRINRFTPQLREVFSVKSHDIGRSISDITNSVIYDDLEKDALAVLNDLVPVEREVTSREGRSFIVRMRPYRTTEDRIDGVVITLVDVTGLKRAEEGLRQSEQRFRALLDATSDMLFTLNRDWTEMRELEGGSFPPEVQRRSTNWMDEHVLREDRPQVFEAIRESISNKSPVEVEHRVLRSDVTTGWTLTRAVPILDEHEEIVEWFGASSDITARKSAENALREADRSKNEFLAVLSHELRNPLAPLRTGVDLLKQAQSRPELIETVRPMMERQLAHLVRLIDDLLDISRISQGRIQLQRVPVDLNAAVDAAIEQMQAAISERHHEVMVNLSPDSLPVNGDFERLTEIVANLLSNAVKYTDSGGRIQIVSEVEDECAVVRVHDNGYGIPAERLPKLFELFSQVPEHRGRTGGGGLGIGLALSRQLAELHGGTITAESNGLDRGAEFVVRLPLNRVEGGGPPGEHADARRGTARRVLVVEDNRDAADTLHMMLELMGHAVQTAEDGERALHHVETFRPDLVLLDVGLPGMDGVEVARRLRAMPDGENITLVAVTGWGQDDDLGRSREAGFDDHLIKPVDAGAIKQVLAAPARRRTAAGDAPAGQSDARQEPPASR